MNKPLRILEGSAKPHEPFWRIIDAADAESGEPEIEFYGAISEYSWFEDDITPGIFKADLMNTGQGGPVTIRIHSAGGDVFAASAIRSMIVDYPGRVTTRIDGLCASAATFVAMAGDVVKMQDSAYFMIHDPWMMTWGTVDDLKVAVRILNTIKEGIIDTYKTKTGLDPERLSRMMSAETWLTASQAKELGFVDEVINTISKNYEWAVPQNAAILNLLTNVPPDLLEILSSEQVPAITENEPNLSGEGTDPIEREVASLRDYLKIFG